MSSGLPLDELAGPHSIDDDSGKSSDLCSICAFPVRAILCNYGSQWRSCRSAPDQHQHRWYSSLITAAVSAASVLIDLAYSPTRSPQSRQQRPSSDTRANLVHHAVANRHRALATAVPALGGLTLPGKLLRDFLNAGPYTATCLRVESDTMWLKKPYLNRSSSFESTCDARSSPSRRGQHSGHCNSPAPRTSC